MKDAMIATELGIVPAMPEHLYHARPELSSTEARILLQPGGPARYRWAKDHPPLIGPSTKFDVGSAVHSKVLGAGYEIVIVDAADWRTKAAQVERDEARDAGKVPLLRGEFETVDAMAESVLSNPTAAALFHQAGDAEVSVFGHDDGVDTRARFDFLPDLTLDRPVAVDLKTTAGQASPDDFGKAVARYRYDVQQEHYLHTLNRAGVDGNQPVFVFVVVEKVAPYLVATFQLPDVWRERGRKGAQRARELYAEGTRTNVWPGLDTDVQFVDMPGWFAFQDSETGA